MNITTNSIVKIIRLFPTLFTTSQHAISAMLPDAPLSQCSSLYRAMQQQAFYFISRKYVHDAQQK
ncbi:hypothetical protein NQ318_014500 [Aromia moschata]|uniref:Uncharacterized protein n=1 Tax=Aromia moschata TaxID=1265417 RepID=A0AAV8YKR7_9CUCU|nr:hypothetical protein NQ318_014500 [Aromia moschata]